MTIGRRTLRSLFSLIVLATVPTASYALTGLTADVQGEQMTAGNCSGIADKVVLSNCDGTAKSYAGITIEKKAGSANPAWVKATESDPDSLTIENATITATQPLSASNPAIVRFWGTFDAPPQADSSASPPQKVTFSATADGYMRRGSNAAKDDTFTMTTWWDDLTDSNPQDVIGSVLTKLVTSTIQSYGNFSFSTSEPPITTGLTGGRIMKGEGKFTAIYSGDKLTLTSMIIQGTTTVDIRGAKEGTDSGVFDEYTEQFILDRNADSKRDRKPR